MPTALADPVLNTVKSPPTVTTGGWVKIYGPPGTGKTSKLLEILEDLVKNQGVHPSKIAYVSFTKAAIREAINRVLSSGLPIAENEIPWFRTLHSAAFRLLSLDAKTIEGRVVNLVSTNKLWFNFCKNYGIQTPSAESDVSDSIDVDEVPFWPEDQEGGESGKVASFINLARNRRPLTQDYSSIKFDPSPFTNLTPELLSSYTNEWKKLLEQEGRFDFARMLEVCIRDDYYPVDIEVLILDEAQDISPLQLEMLLSWSKHAKICYAAGDKDQAIHEYQGGDATLMDRLQPTLEVIPLTVSHRCPEAIVNVALTLIRRNSVRTGVDWGSGVTSHKGLVETDIDIPYQKLWQFRKEGDTTYIIARNKYLLRPVVRKLMEDGMPFCNLSGFPGIPPTNEKMLSLISLHTSAKAEPRQLRNLILSLPGIVFEGFGKRGAKNQSNFSRETSKIKNMPDNLDLIASKYGLKKHITDILSNFYKGCAYLISVRPYEKHSINYYVSMAKKYGVEHLNTMPPLTLSTVHGVKGGQADNIILLTDLAYKTFMEYTYDPEQERRVFYVAVTRTKKRLIIVGSKQSRCFDEIYSCL